MSAAKKILSSEQGFTIASVISQLAILLIAFVGFQQVSTFMYKKMREPVDLVSRAGIHSNLKSWLENPNVWDATVKSTANPTELLNCYTQRNATACAAYNANWQAVTEVVDPSGFKIIDENDQDLGWSAEGFRCDSLSQANDKCRYKVRILWRSVCETAACSAYYIELRSQFIDYLNYSNGSQPSESKYDFFVLR